MRLERARLCSALFVGVLLGCQGEQPPQPASEAQAADVKSAVAFSNVISAQEVREGLWLLSDFTEKRVIAYWSIGDSIVPIDRVGPGPREYLRPAFLWRLSGDTTLMVNQLQLRWDIFIGPRLAATLPPLGRANEGLISFDTLGQMLRIRNGSSATDSQFVEMVDRSNGAVRTVARLEPPVPGYETTPPPYPGQWESVHLAPDGWIAIVRTAPYRVDWLRPDGQVIRGDSIPVQDVPVNADEKSYYLSHLPSERAKERIAESTWPERVPAMANGNMSFHFSPSGELLVERVRSTVAPGRVYDVIDRRGIKIDQISLPRESKIVAAGQRAALILTEDGDGFQRPSLRPWLAREN